MNRKLWKIHSIPLINKQLDGKDFNTWTSFQDSSKVISNYENVVYFKSATIYQQQ